MYGFLAGFSSPESIFAEKYLFHVLSPLSKNMSIFSKIALFHINCNFIGKVSPMYDFLAGFSSPEFFVVVLSPFSVNMKYVHFSAKIDSGELKPARKPYIGLTLPMK